MVVPKKPDSDDGHSHLSREPFGRVGVSLPTQTGRDPYGVTDHRIALPRQFAWASRHNAFFVDFREALPRGRAR